MKAFTCLFFSVVLFLACFCYFSKAAVTLQHVNSTVPTPDSTIPPWIIDNEIMSWEPPLEFSKKFPYYIAGYDFEKRPVAIVEFGKWDIRSIVEQGEEQVQILKNYTSQFVNRMLLLKSPYADAEDGSVAIFDAEGYQFRQLRHMETSKFLMEQALYLNVVEPYAHKVIVINSNFVIETLISMVRSIGGRFFDKVETYGPNPSRWIPALREIIPKDQLPYWYGGSKDFKPVHVYG